MWLIMTALAAVISTALWRIKGHGDKYKLGLLSLIFWGATIMWLVDHMMAYLTEGGEFFELGKNATLLGISAIGLGLLVWFIALLISSHKTFFKKTSKA